MKRFINLSLFFIVCLTVQGQALGATTEIVKASFIPIEERLVARSDKRYAGEIRCLSGCFSENIGNFVVRFETNDGEFISDIFLSKENRPKEMYKLNTEDGGETLFIEDYQSRIFTLEVRPNNGNPVYYSCLLNDNYSAYAFLDRAGYQTLKNQINKSVRNGLISFSNEMGIQSTKYFIFQLQLTWKR